MQTHMSGKVSLWTIWAIVSSLMRLNIKFNYCQDQWSYLRARLQGGGLLYEGQQAQAVTPHLLTANQQLSLASVSWFVLCPLVYTLFTLFKDLILSCRQLSSPVKIYYISISKLVQKSKMDTLWHFMWDRGLMMYFTVCVTPWTSDKCQQLKSSFSFSQCLNILKSTSLSFHFIPSQKMSHC